MAKSENPFAELVEVLKHNGYSMTPLSEIPGPHFFNLLKKAGWDQAWSGTGRTHLLMRLRDPNRGQPCGIVTLMDFARALETGCAFGADQWISYHYSAVFVVNWRQRGFVTFFPLGKPAAD
jgi:hypothetical protein